MQNKKTIQHCLIIFILFYYSLPAKSDILVLDYKDPAAVLSVEDAELIQENKNVMIDGRRYNNFALKLSNGFLYEGYITKCSDDYAIKLSEQEKRQLSHCTDQVINVVDSLLEKTPDLKFYSGGTQYVYQGVEGSTPYYYYSAAVVTSYYRTENDQYPLYGLVYQCKQVVNKNEEHDSNKEDEVNRFFELARKSCTNILKK